ncbi:MAG: LuxR family transcriptional regulator [Nocardioides sp.]|nr:LuxR family transcriptional regulator [Nocardioides sp.]
MGAYGPEQRALLEDEATTLYETVVVAGGIAADDPRLGEGSPTRPAFDLLVEIGLLVHSSEHDVWVAEDPTTVQARVITPMSQEGARLLAESSEWAGAFGTLGQAWRRSPRASGRGPITHLHDEGIAAYVSGIVAECEHEILSAQPQTGRNAQTLAVAALRDTAALERGIKMRTLYQHSARRSSITHRYVAAVSARGAEVRTLDEFFNRMIVIDRRVAIIPGDDNLRLAVAVREPHIVAYLVDVFQRSWERARPFTNRETSLMRDIAVEQRAMTIRMLIEGHSDPTSAKRVGVSPRTYAGYVADLKAEYEAETRFQLGYTMGTRGISGLEPQPLDD